jgi:hypothetical protein
MARDRAADKLKVKTARQKKLAIGGAVVLVVLLVVQVPKTMKMLNKSPKAPVVAASSTTPATTTPATITTAAPVTPTPSSSASSQTLVSAVAVSADPGQLRTFERFASKDPFTAQVSSGGGTSGPPSPPKPPTSTTSTTPVAVTPPPAPAPTAAVISLNGVLMSVTVSSAFPTSGPIFDRAGSLFQLVSLTAKTAKVAIVGGSYADGAPTLTLTVGKPVTLQNTADGTRYTLVLEPQGTQVPPSGTTTTTPASPPTTTAPNSVVPSGP